MLHDLPLAVQPDRMLVMQDGAVAGHGESYDGTVHAALIEAFDHAIALIPATSPSKLPTVPCCWWDDCRCRPLKTFDLANGFFLKALFQLRRKYIFTKTRVSIEIGTLPLLIARISKKP